MRRRVYRSLEEFTGKGFGVSWFRKFIIILILANVVAVILESHPRYRAAYGDWFFRFELFSVFVFTVEYVLRLWGAVEAPECRGLPAWKARFRYATRPLALIDFLAIAPFYLSFFVQIDLRYLRTLRLLRLLKLSHYFPGLELFIKVIRAQLPSLAAASLIMVILILVSAIAMFTLEHPVQPDKFGSLAESVWWSVVTLTTVGYGDVTPLTFGGRFLGGVIMLLGVGVVALPAAMLAGRFAGELQMQREELSKQVANFVEDGWLDATEQDELDELKRKLGMSDDDMQRLVRTERKRTTKGMRCPHCGKAISDSGE